MSALFYKETGQGRPVILLHGFLETHHIWQQLSEQLSHYYRVITLDLPGFGKSPLPQQHSFSLTDVALEINTLLKDLKAEKSTVIGHSLGGYVTLAMTELAPEFFSSVGLFHSTAYADSAEKRESRTKTIEFVERNGALAFTSNFIPPLFADPSHAAIPAIVEMASKTSRDTVVQYLRAMRDRPDRTNVIQKFGGPVLFLAGSKDTVISRESLINQSELNKRAFLRVFEGVGHMGMIEAPEDSFDTLKTFLEKET